MKHKTIISSILTICTLVSVLSCSQFEEMNQNPNRLKFNEASPSKLIQSVICSGHWAVFYRSWKVNSPLMQYSVQVNGTELTANYDIKETESSVIWQNIYRWAGNAAHMVKLAREQGDPNMEAIGTTMKIYLMDVLTSCFGDIPYSEALSWDEGITYPAYDTQELAYTLMIEELDHANQIYDLSKEMDFSVRDLLYGGDLSKWKKFTNSLRLRLLMRCSKCRMSEMDPIAQMQKMVSAPDTYPLFASNDDAAILRYTGVNPFYNSFGPSTATDPMTMNNKMCSTFVDILTSAADPRLPFMMDANKGEYIGLKPGQTNDYIASMNDQACNYAKALSTDTSPSTLMNYAEVLFILAEAQYRGLVQTGKSEKELYEEAVTASIRQWTGNESWIGGHFFEEPSTATYDGTLKKIMEQKYVADFLVGVEAWCDYRRTGLPEMASGPALENKDDTGKAVLPTRLRYPLITQTSNYDNWHKAVSNLETGKDDMLSRVWFAKGNVY